MKYILFTLLMARTVACSELNQSHVPVPPGIACPSDTIIPQLQGRLDSAEKEIRHLKQFHLPWAYRMGYQKGGLTTLELINNRPGFSLQDIMMQLSEDSTEYFQMIYNSSANGN